MDYVMLRGIFMPGGVTDAQVKYYVDLLAKVRQTPEWKAYMDKGAFNQTSMSGAEYKAWVEKNEQLHKELMTSAGFIAKQ
jgi:tripartite-type tricarboxylate transporter receptor subunit TctC